MRVLIAYMGWMTALGTAYFVLVSKQYFIAVSIVWALIGLSGVTAIVFGVLKYKPTAWRGWILLALANLFFVSGDTYYRVLHYWFHKVNPFPSLSDLFYLVTYPLFAAGMYVFIKHRSATKSDRGVILDAATFTVGLGLLVWVYLVVPNLDAPTSLIVKLTSIAYPLGDTLVWAMIVRLLVIDARTWAIRFLAFGALGLISADIIYAIIQFSGGWQVGTYVDLGWLSFYAFWGVAALLPSMKQLDKPIPKTQTIRTSRLVLLAGTALAAPVVLLVETLRGNTDKVAIVVAVFAAALFILVILRLFTLVKEINVRDTEINFQKRISAATDSLDVGLLMTFKDQNDISYNPALVSILGLKEVITASGNPDPTTFLELMSEKLRPIPSFDLHKIINDCQTSGQPIEIKKAPCGSRTLSIFVAPVITDESKIIGSVLLIQDITEAEVMERSKDEFFSIASHELRTPLTAIKGNSSMILDFYKDALKDPSLKEMIIDVHDSSVRLIEVVNEFLDTSELEQGKMSFAYQEVDLKEIIENVAHEMQQVFKDKKLHLELGKQKLDKLPAVWVDKNKLKQVIYNLIGNALKFTETGGVSIQTSVEGPLILVEVTDTGRGIPLASQKLLFHKFQQAGDSLITRDTAHGTGLGLYISKMIVEGMGGTIKLARSEESKGTTFSFTVRVATAELQAITKQLKQRTDTTTGLTR